MYYQSINPKSNHESSNSNGIALAEKNRLNVVSKAAL